LTATHFLLIRHAKNDWVGERLPGHTAGIHLNEAGHAEAALLAERLGDYPIDALYASPLERAQETAGYIARRKGLPLGTLPELVDLDTGDLTGMTVKDASQLPVWAGIQAFPSLTRLPAGETLWEMQVRVVAALEQLRQRHGGETVAVVAHADVIKVAAAHYAGLPLDMFQRLVVATTSVTVVGFGPGGPRLVALNHTAVLPQPEREPPPTAQTAPEELAADVH
jgi:probable phosphoglycerate mutase